MFAGCISICSVTCNRILVALKALMNPNKICKCISQISIDISCLYHVPNFVLKTLPAWHRYSVVDFAALIFADARRCGLPFKQHSSSESLFIMNQTLRSFRIQNPSRTQRSAGPKENSKRCAEYFERSSINHRIKCFYGTENGELVFSPSIHSRLSSVFFLLAMLIVSHLLRTFGFLKTFLTNTQ